MRSAHFVLALLVAAVNTTASADPPAGTSSSLPGHFVPFSKLSTCPNLKPRPVPTAAWDIRPDDIKVVMALGDSITAALLARSRRDSYRSQAPELDPDHPEQAVWSTPIRILPNELLEYRGLSYPIGADPGAITLPNILSRYTSVRGGSVGSHLPIACLGPICMRPDEDGLNAALGGSTSASLLSQVRDYILPTLERMDVDKSGWMFANIGIGANDICAFCLAPNTSLPLVGSPQQFARDIKTAVELLRTRAPRLIVNIVGLLRVSSVYKLTSRDPYCQSLPTSPLPPLIPHLSWECSCALLPGPAGDYTRQRMDELGEAYDQAVLDLLAEWEREGDEGFGAVWQPGSAIDLAHWPIEALSPVDCFHPSEETHQRVAAGIWNRLTLGKEEKARPIKWENEVMVRCLEEGDRIHVRQISGPAGDGP